MRLRHEDDLSRDAPTNAFVLLGIDPVLERNYWRARRLAARLSADNDMNNHDEPTAASAPILDAFIASAALVTLAARDSATRADVVNAAGWLRRLWNDAVDNVRFTDVAYFDQTFSMGGGSKDDLAAVSGYIAESAHGAAWLFAQKIAQTTWKKQHVLGADLKVVTHAEAAWPEFRKMIWNAPLPQVSQVLQWVCEEYLSGVWNDRKMWVHGDADAVAARELPSVLTISGIDPDGVLVLRTIENVEESRMREIEKAVQLVLQRASLPLDFSVEVITSGTTVEVGSSASGLMPPKRDPRPFCEALIKSFDAYADLLAARADDAACRAAHAMLIHPILELELLAEDLGIGVPKLRWFQNDYWPHSAPERMRDARREMLDVMTKVTREHLTSLKSSATVTFQQPAEDQLAAAVKKQSLTRAKAAEIMRNCPVKGGKLPSLNELQRTYGGSINTYANAARDKRYPDLAKFLPVSPTGGQDSIAMGEEQFREPKPEQAIDDENELQWAREFANREEKVLLNSADPQRVREGVDRVRSRKAQ